MLTSILLTSGINIPHGVWASVSLLVVIGGLQHQGNIRKKAAERALGTMFGALIGLALVFQFSISGSLYLTYALLSISTGICAYQAVGKGGYIALLTAITMCIVAGHGDNSIEIGLWRTANVLIGIAIALAFSFALPLYATYAWRHNLAKNLRRCARTYNRIMTGMPMTPDEQIATFAELSSRLITLRTLMPSVAKETDLPLARLEEIQRQHRAILSSLELMASVPLECLRADHPGLPELRFMQEGKQMPRTLLGISRALRLRDTRCLEAGPAGAGASASIASDIAPKLPASLEGPHWLLQQMLEQTEHMRQLLLEAKQTPLFSL